MPESQQLDVYQDWLGITETARPLNHYQLLKLDQFEDDQHIIRKSYKKLNAHTRKYSSGNYAIESQQLLNELAKAMLCLTDIERKMEYDESLGRKKVADLQQLELDEILLHHGVVSRAQIEEAKTYAEALGFSLRDALSQKTDIAQDTLMQAYAQSLGLPFLRLEDVTTDASLYAKISTVLARTHSVAPVMIENDELLLASPNPLNLQLEEDLILRIGMRIRMVLCTPADINEVINEHYPREAADAELASRGIQEEDLEPSGLAKVWGKIKKWVEENNKK